MQEMMQQQTHSACLRNARCVVPDAIEAKTLFLDHGRIVSAKPRAGWTQDLSGHLVFPGLVNAHDHLHMNNIPHLPHASPFPNSYVWMDAFQPYLNDPAVRAARAIPIEQRYWQGALKNLFCGVMMVAHHDPWHPIFDDPHFPVRVLRRFGWSHSLGLGSPRRDRSSLQYGPPIPESFCNTPSSWPWIIHLAEGTDAIAASELSELDRLGCLKENSILVHGVGLTEGNRRRILACGAGVVWCPGSNLELLGRTLKPRCLFDGGRLALGSDSRISSEGDLLCELRLAAAIGEMTPPELLRMVTDVPSRLLRIPDAGGLNIGQRADLVIACDTGADPYRTLLELERRDMRAVICGGKPAITDPDFAGWFDACGIAVTSVRLDGRPKLCATDLLGPSGAAALEPGFEAAEGGLATQMETEVQ